MLTERLRAAIESAAHLSPEAQDKLAEDIEVAVENAQWDAELNDPQYDAIMQGLIARAKQQPKLPFPAPRDMGDPEELDERDKDADGAVEE